MSIKYKNILAQNIYNIMFPLLGDIMTQNVLKIQLKKLGKTEETIEHDDLPIIADAIKNGLTIFLGSEKSSMVAGQIMSIK